MQSRQRPTLARLEQESRLAVVEAEQSRVRTLESELTRLHWETFAPAERTLLQVPEPAREVSQRIRRSLRSSALRGVPLTDRGSRRERRDAADEQAERVLVAQRTGNLVRTQYLQYGIDEQWTELKNHEVYTVIETVDAAFADNASDSTCIDAGTNAANGHTYVTVVVLFGTPEMVPDRKPAATPGGKPTMKRRSKTERNAVYLEAMASTVMATVKESFAVSPATDDVNVIVLAQQESGAPRPVYLGAFSRRRYTGTNWIGMDAVDEMMSADLAEIQLKGVAKTVSPLRGVTGVETLAEAFLTGEDHVV